MFQRPTNHCRLPVPPTHLNMDSSKIYQGWCWPSNQLQPCCECGHNNFNLCIKTVVEAIDSGHLLLPMSALVPHLQVWLTSRHPQTSTVCQKKSRVYPCSRRRLVHAQRFPISLPAELYSSSYCKCWAEHNPRRHQTQLPPYPEAPVISLSLLCVKWKM